jgi:type IVB pilus formation R64 PilN family outer membrane protein
MKNLSKPLIALVIAGLLSGCGAPLKQTTAAALQSAPIESVRVDGPGPNATGSADDLRMRDAAARSPALVKHATAPWIGATLMPATATDELPALFSEPYMLDFGPGSVSIGVVAARLTKITGVPVRVRDDVYKRSPEASARSEPRQAAPIAMPTQPQGPVIVPSTGGAMPVVSFPTAAAPAQAVSGDREITIDSVNLKWDGKLKDFLDHLTNTLSLSWEYRDGAVVISRLVTTTYTVDIHSGTQKLSVTHGSTSGGSTQSGGMTAALAKSTQLTETSPDLDTFKAIVESIKTMASAVEGSQVVANPATGSIMVVTAKEVQAQVRDYLQHELAKARGMINVTLDIYKVSRTDADEKAIDWNLVLKSVSGKSSIQIGSPAASIDPSASSFKLTRLTGRAADSSLILNALRTQGFTVNHHPVSLALANGRYKSVSEPRSVYFVKETTTAAASAVVGSTTTAIPGMKTEALSLGDMYTVMARMTEDNQVLINYNFTFSSLNKLDKFESKSGETFIQTPDVKSITDSGEATVEPGYAYLTTALSRLTVKDEDKSLGQGVPWFLGGSSVKGIGREYLIVFVRATRLN